jgi:hypothetical protein
MAILKEEYDDAETQIYCAQLLMLDCSTYKPRAAAKTKTTAAIPLPDNAPLADLVVFVALEGPVTFAVVTEAP